MLAKLLVFNGVYSCVCVCVCVCVCLSVCLHKNLKNYWSEIDETC